MGIKICEEYNLQLKGPLLSDILIDVVPDNSYTGQMPSNISETSSAKHFTLSHLYTNEQNLDQAAEKSEIEWQWTGEIMSKMRQMS